MLRQKKPSTGAVAHAVVGNSKEKKKGMIPSLLRKTKTDHAVRLTPFKKKQVSKPKPPPPPVESVQIQPGASGDGNSSSKVSDLTDHGNYAKKEKRPVATAVDPGNHAKKEERPVATAVATANKEANQSSSTEFSYSNVANPKPQNPHEKKQATANPGEMQIAAKSGRAAVGISPGRVILSRHAAQPAAKNVDNDDHKRQGGKKKSMDLDKGLRFAAPTPVVLNRVVLNASTANEATAGQRPRSRQRDRGTAETTTIPQIDVSPAQAVPPSEPQVEKGVGHRDDVQPPATTEQVGEKEPLSDRKVVSLLDEELTTEGSVPSVATEEKSKKLAFEKVKALLNRMNPRKESKQQSAESSSDHTVVEEEKVAPLGVTESDIMTPRANNTTASVGKEDDDLAMPADPSPRHLREDAASPPVQSPPRLSSTRALPRDAPTSPEQERRSIDAPESVASVALDDRDEAVTRDDEPVSRATEKRSEEEEVVRGQSQTRASDAAVASPRVEGTGATSPRVLTDRNNTDQAPKTEKSLRDRVRGKAFKAKQAKDVKSDAKRRPLTVKTNPFDDSSDDEIPVPALDSTLPPPRSTRRTPRKSSKSPRKTKKATVTGGPLAESKNPMTALKKKAEEKAGKHKAKISSHVPMDENGFQNIEARNVGRSRNVNSKHPADEHSRASLPHEIALAVDDPVSDLDQSLRQFPVKQVVAEASDAVSFLESRGSMGTNGPKGQKNDRYAPMVSTSAKVPKADIYPKPEPIRGRRRAAALAYSSSEQHTFKGRKALADSISDTRGSTTHGDSTRGWSVDHIESGDTAEIAGGAVLNTCSQTPVGQMFIDRFLSKKEEGNRALVQESGNDEKCPPASAICYAASIPNTQFIQRYVGENGVAFDDGSKRIDAGVRIVSDSEFRANGNRSSIVAGPKKSSQLGRSRGYLSEAEEEDLSPFADVLNRAAPLRRSEETPSDPEPAGGSGPWVSKAVPPLKRKMFSFEGNNGPVEPDGRSTVASRAQESAVAEDPIGAEPIHSSDYRNSESVASTEGNLPDPKSMARKIIASDSDDQVFSSSDRKLESVASPRGKVPDAATVDPEIVAADSEDPSPRYDRYHISAEGPVRKEISPESPKKGPSPESPVDYLKGLFFRTSGQRAKVGGSPDESEELNPRSTNVPSNTKSLQTVSKSVGETKKKKGLTVRNRTNESPPPTELIDLTAIESLDDLDGCSDGEWLFDLSPKNSLDAELANQTSDLESLMDFAVRRLGIKNEQDELDKYTSLEKSAGLDNVIGHANEEIESLENGRHMAGKEGIVSVQTGENLPTSDPKGTVVVVRAHEANFVGATGPRVPLVVGIPVSSDKRYPDEPILENSIYEGRQEVNNEERTMHFAARPDSSSTGDHRMDRSDNSVADNETAHTSIAPKSTDAVASSQSRRSASSGMELPPKSHGSGEENDVAQHVLRALRQKESGNDEENELTTTSDELFADAFDAEMTASDTQPRVRAHSSDSASHFNNAGENTVLEGDKYDDEAGLPSLLAKMHQDIRQNDERKGPLPETRRNVVTTRGSDFAVPERTTVLGPSPELNKASRRRGPLPEDFSRRPPEDVATRSATPEKRRRPMPEDRMTGVPEVPRTKMTQANPTVLVEDGLPDDDSYAAEGVKALPTGRDTDAVDIMKLKKAPSSRSGVSSVVLNRPPVEVVDETAVDYVASMGTSDGSDGPQGPSPPGPSAASSDPAEHHPETKNTLRPLVPEESIPRNGDLQLHSPVGSSVALVALSSAALAGGAYMSDAKQEHSETTSEVAVRRDFLDFLCEGAEAMLCGMEPDRFPAAREDLSDLSVVKKSSKESQSVQRALDGSMGNHVEQKDFNIAQASVKESGGKTPWSLMKALALDDESEQSSSQKCASATSNSTNRLGAVAATTAAVALGTSTRNYNDKRDTAGSMVSVPGAGIDQADKERTETGDSSLLNTATPNETTNNTAESSGTTSRESPATTGSTTAAKVMTISAVPESDLHWPSSSEPKTTESSLPKEEDQFVHSGTRDTSGDNQNANELDCVEVQRECDSPFPEMALAVAATAPVLAALDEALSPIPDERSEQKESVEVVVAESDVTEVKGEKTDQSKVGEALQLEDQGPAEIQNDATEQGREQQEMLEDLVEVHGDSIEVETVARSQTTQKSGTKTDDPSEVKETPLPEVIDVTRADSQSPQKKAEEKVEHSVAVAEAPGAVDAERDFLRKFFERAGAMLMLDRATEDSRTFGNDDLDIDGSSTISEGGDHQSTLAATLSNEDGTMNGATQGDQETTLAPTLSHDDGTFNTREAEPSLRTKSSGSHKNQASTIAPTSSNDDGTFHTREADRSLRTKTSGSQKNEAASTGAQTLSIDDGTLNTKDGEGFIRSKAPAPQKTTEVAEKVQGSAPTSGYQQQRDSRESEESKSKTIGADGSKTTDTQDLTFAMGDLFVSEMSKALAPAVDTDRQNGSTVLEGDSEQPPGPVSTITSSARILEAPAEIEIEITLSTGSNLDSPSEHNGSKLDAPSREGDGSKLDSPSQQNQEFEAVASENNSATENSLRTSDARLENVGDGSSVTSAALASKEIDQEEEQVQGVETDQSSKYSIAAHLLEARAESVASSSRRSAAPDAPGSKDVVGPARSKDVVTPRTEKQIEGEDNGKTVLRSRTILKQISAKRSSSRKKSRRSEEKSPSNIVEKSTQDTEEEQEPSAGFPSNLRWGRLFSVLPNEISFSGSQSNVEQPPASSNKTTPASRKDPEDDRHGPDPPEKTPFEDRQKTPSDIDNDDLSMDYDHEDDSLLLALTRSDGELDLEQAAEMVESAVLAFRAKSPKKATQSPSKSDRALNLEKVVPAMNFEEATTLSIGRGAKSPKKANEEVTTKGEDDCRSPKSRSSVSSGVSQETGSSVPESVVIRSGQDKKKFSRSPRLSSVLERLHTRTSGNGETFVSSIDADPVDVEELFSRYDNIVKHMVVLDEGRLHRAQSRQITTVIDVTDDPRQSEGLEGPAKLEKIETAPREDREPSRDAEMSPRKSPSAFDSQKILSRLQKKRAEARNGKNSPRRSNISSIPPSASFGSEMSATPSQKARNLRVQLDQALKTSAAIRSTQERLGAELSTFKQKLQAQRQAFSPAHSPRGSPRNRSPRGSPRNRSPQQDPRTSHGSEPSRTVVWQAPTTQPSRDLSSTSFPDITSARAYSSFGVAKNGPSPSSPKDRLSMERSAAETRSPPQSPSDDRITQQRLETSPSRQAMAGDEAPQMILAESSSQDSLLELSDAESDTTKSRRAEEEELQNIERILQGLRAEESKRQVIVHPAE